eukprot:COSAG04_NODE_18268_length_446_cov_0.718391_1_plen_48_part_01
MAWLGLRRGLGLGLALGLWLGLKLRAMQPQYFRAAFLGPWGGWVPAEL